MHKRGFTLIELSIVLVIIGLIVGGVLVGRDLIRAAELRTITTEVEQYKAAYNTFQLKYNCIPGDCKNAASLISGAVNGNGDDVILWPDSSTIDDADLPPETYQAFYQLSAAHFIPGSYPGTDAGWLPVIGTDVPPSKISKSVGVGMRHMVVFGQEGNYIFYASSIPAHGSWAGVTNAGKFWGPALNPLEAQSVDTKMDDGIPQTGGVMGDALSTPPPSGWVSCPVTGASYSFGEPHPIIGAYNIVSGEKEPTCKMYFRF